jgi:D-arabinose 1-dehydrogenase-like Zn-dependent alcohol dehydrogenase
MRSFPGPPLRWLPPSPRRGSLPNRSERRSFGYGATPFETKLVIPYGGTQAELIEVLALGASGRITSRVERFRLDEVEEIYRRLRERTVEGRTVVLADN